MSKRKPLVAINAIHSKSGGGLVYLNKVLPHLVACDDFDWVLICDSKYQDRINIPDGLEVFSCDVPSNFALMHMWEQFVLPFKLRALNVSVTWCVANYVSFLSPKPINLLTNNPKVAAYAVGLSTRMYWLLVVLMSKFSLLRCSAILTNGIEMQNVFISGVWSFAKNKTINAPSGCDVQLNGNVKKRPHEILAVGDYYVHKGYEELLRAFLNVRKENEQARLAIVGRPMDTEVAAFIDKFIIEHGLTSCVDVLGVMPHDQLLKRMSEASVYVSLSKAEAFSLTLLEALTVGAPAVVIDYSFQREVAGSEGAFYVSESNVVEGASHAILSLLESDDLRQRYSKAGLEAVKGFTWYKTAVNVLSAIRNSL